MATRARTVELRASEPAPLIRRLQRLTALAPATRWIVVAGAITFAMNVLISRYLFWDSYLDLEAGRYIAHHGIPHHEVLTVAASRDWIDQQWLAHFAYYGAWALGGYPALALLSSLLIGGAFTGLAALLVSRGVPAVRAALWTFAAFVACLGNTVIRAQSFAYPLFVLALWLVLTDSRAARMRRRTLLLPALLILWANLHGTVVLAAALVALYAASRALPRIRAVAPSKDRLAYAALALAAPATIFATPYGLSVTSYYSSLIGNGVVAHSIVEWAPPSFGNPVSWPFIVLLLLVVGIVGYALGRGFRPPSVLLGSTAITAALAATGVRYQAWFALVGVVLAADALAAVNRPPFPVSTRFEWAAAVSAAAVAIGVVAVLVGTASSRFERLTPRRAVSIAGAYLARHPGATVLADDETASALLWSKPVSLGRVAFDARLEQYEQDDLRRWFRFINVSGPDWLSIAAKYDVLLVSRRAHSALARRLLRLHDWRTLYSDADGVVLVRKGA